MINVEKTVFISYRRTNAPWALAIFKDLTQHGYDVFFDYQGIPSGDFESVILENIRARAHFLVLLTPSALQRCGDPGDWLRREIEEAMERRRNIVPLFLEGFDFGAPAIASKLTGKLAALKSYNGMSVPTEYFDAAMDRLRNTFLQVPLNAVLHPATESAKRVASEQQAAAAAAPAVQRKDLTAQAWFERGVSAKDPDEQYRCFSNAIRLNPDLPEPYYNRAIVNYGKGDKESALRDYDEAIRLKPDFAWAHFNRGGLYLEKGDGERALKDYNEAVQLEPDNADFRARQSLVSNLVNYFRR